MYHRTINSSGEPRYGDDTRNVGVLNTIFSFNIHVKNYRISLEIMQCHTLKSQKCIYIPLSFLIQKIVSWTFLIVLHLCHWHELCYCCRQQKWWTCICPGWGSLWLSGCRFHHLSTIYQKDVMTYLLITTELKIF